MVVSGQLGVYRLCESGQVLNGGSGHVSQVLNGGDGTVGCVSAL